MSNKKDKPAKKGLVGWIFDFAGEKKRAIPLECVLCPFKCSVLYCTLFYNCTDCTSAYGWSSRLAALPACLLEQSLICRRALSKIL